MDGILCPCGKNIYIHVQVFWKDSSHAHKNVHCSRSQIHDSHSCIHMGGIAMKGAKVFVNNQVFMYPTYFEHVSHITYKWYKYNIFNIMFICSWIFHPMDMKSFHCVVKMLLHMQKTCWHVLKTTIKYERAFVYSNLYQMFTNFIWTWIYFIKSGPGVQSLKKAYMLVFTFFYRTT
jgi:hypothetical protein